MALIASCDDGVTYVSEDKFIDEYNKQKKMGPKKATHVKIRKQIIAKRLAHEFIANSTKKDPKYEAELKSLRKRLQETR